MRRRISQAYPMVRVNEPPFFVLCLLFPFFCSASSFELYTSSTDAMLREKLCLVKPKKPIYASHINMQTARNNVDETDDSKSLVRVYYKATRNEGCCLQPTLCMDKSKPVNKRPSPASPLWAQNIENERSPC